MEDYKQYTESANTTSLRIPHEENYAAQTRIDNTPRQIVIQPLNGFGYILQIGCQHFAITELDIALDAIEAYYKNPNEVEEEFRNNKPKTIEDIKSFLKNQL